MPALSLKQCFWGLLVFLVPCTYAMWHIDIGLQNTTTPSGIVSFELCAFSNNCADALVAWGAEGQRLAMLSLGLDFLFMLLYPTFIGVCLLLAATRLPTRLSAATRGAAGLMLGAAIADAIETYSLIQLVLQHTDTYYPWLAALFASIKFAILGLCLLWLVTVMLYSVLRRKTT